jgi:hypothetical protein
VGEIERFNAKLARQKNKSKILDFWGENFDFLR